MPEFEPGKRTFRGWFSPAVGGLTFLVVLLALLWSLHIRKMEKTAEHLTSVANVVHKELGARLSKLANSMAALANGAKGGGLETDGWRRIARNFAEKHASVVAIVCSDAKGEQLWVEKPGAGNSLDSLMLSLPPQQRFLLPANTTWNGNVHDRDGRRYFVLHVAAPANDRDIGAVSCFVDAEVLLSEVVPPSSGAGYRVQSITTLPDGTYSVPLPKSVYRLVSVDNLAAGVVFSVQPIETETDIEIVGLVVLAGFLIIGLVWVQYRESLWVARAEQAEAERDDQFSVFASVALVGIFHTDAEGSYTYVNDRWCQMTGLTPEEAMGDGWLKTLHPDDRARIAVEWTVAARDGVKFDSRYRFVAPNGSLTWVAGKAAAVRDKEGRCTGYFGSLTDITEGKLNEIRLASLFEGAPVSLWLEDFSAVKCRLEKLRESGVEDFRAYFDANPEVIDLCVRDVKILDVNRSTLDLHSAKTKEELMASLHLTFNADSRVAFKEELVALASGATRFSLETSLSTIFGEHRDVVINLLIAPDSPDWSHVYVAIIDLSDRKRAEEALARSEAFLSDTGKVARVGGWELDASTLELRWTDETFRIHEVLCAVTPTYEESLEYYIGADKERFASKIENAIENHQSFDLELNLETGLGKKRCVHVICHPEIEDERVARLSGTIQDITLRKANERERISLERQVQHAQKLESLGVLAGGIAHDFNNILMAILGHADIALHRVEEDSPILENLEAIETSTRRAADLAQQMLAYSGKGKFVIRPISLNDVVTEMVEMLNVSISKKVAIEISLAEALPNFEGDVTQLRQVVMNLITNSSEAIGDQVGVIKLSTGIMSCSRGFLSQLQPQPQPDAEGVNERPEGPYVYLEVSDDGQGMDEATLQRLFDPFFTTKFTGRGLGMAAVLGIARGHQGGVKVESTVGEGTTVTILFPAASRLDSRDLDPAPLPLREEADLMGATVLLADDEPAIRDVGRTMLESLGLRVTLAKDGDDAVALFKQKLDGFDYVLLDLTMPKMSGGQVFDEIQAIDPQARIILVSGYNQLDATAGFVGRDLAGFIQKPFKLSDLKRSLVSAG